MLTIVERTVWVLGGLMVLGSIGAFVYLGPPTGIPKIEIETRETNAQQFNKGLSAEQRTASEAIKKEVREKVSKGGSSRSRALTVTEEFREVPTDTFEHYASRREALNAARQISGEVVPHKDGTNSYKIFNFSPGDPIAKLGFKENDVIDYIDGRKIDFNSELQANGLYNDLVDKMRGGGSMTVHITRNGRPVELNFKVN